MDPVTAIGVASSVITFAQCAYDFIKLMKDVHDSASKQGGLHNREEMIEKLQTLASNCKFRKDDLTAQEKAVNDVAEECDRIANELIDMIKSMTPGKEKDGKYTWRESLKGAFKETMKKGKLDRLKADLQSCIKSLLQQHIFVDR